MRFAYEERYRSASDAVLLKRETSWPAMEACCPSCKSGDIQKVPLAYQEGVSTFKGRTRMRGIAPGLNGPDIFTGTALTDGLSMTDFARRLAPPVKWSFGKLIAWSV